MGLAPCEVVGRSPSQVARMPCAAVVVPDTVTYLGRPGLGVESSTADRLGSAVVQSRGLWGRRCQISLHLRLTREVQSLHQLSGTQTDLMVVPCFLLHLNVEVLEDTEDNAPSSRMKIVQRLARHRSQTAVC